MGPRLRAISGLLALVLLLASCRGGKGKASSDAGPSAGADAGEPNATLFYPSEKGDSLAACPVFIPPQEQKQAALSALLKSYFAGPPCAGSVRAFPEGTGLRAVYLTRPNIAVVDLTARARTGGGTDSEILRIYGLVDTVAFNHPSVDGVQILIDGKEVDSLTGHLDLSRPLPPNSALLPKEALESWRRVRGGV